MYRLQCAWTLKSTLSTFKRSIVCSEPEISVYCIYIQTMYCLQCTWALSLLYLRSNDVPSAVHLNTQLTVSTFKRCTVYNAPEYSAYFVYIQMLNIWRCSVKYSLFSSRLIPTDKDTLNVKYLPYSWHYSACIITSCEAVQVTCPHISACFTFASFLVSSLNKTSSFPFTKWVTSDTRIMLYIWKEI